MRHFHRHMAVYDRLRLFGKIIKNLLNKIISEVRFVFVVFVAKSTDSKKKGIFGDFRKG